MDSSQFRRADHPESAGDRRGVTRPCHLRPAPGRTTDYLRGLLVEHGCLPGRDRYLAAFENWLPTKLGQISDPDARRHIDAFTRWQLLRDRAKREPIPAGAFLNARQCTTVAINFLDWLAGRGRHLES